jgi:DNA repair exonuclease SbcCD nuclease subunit
MRVVAVADVHLGKQPSKVPDALGSAPTLSATQAWRNLIAYCTADPPAALLIAGDLVDDDDNLFEATATVADGVQELVALGTRVIAVNGNHDQKALPRVAGRVSEIEILGLGGTWQAATVEEGGERMRVLGWSFPHARHYDTPVDGALTALAAEPFGGATIGLLHGDLDVAGSPYAPVLRSDLASVPTAAWLLGHQHVTHDLDAQERPIGYLGSLAASDPGEPGRHGAWELQIDGGQVALTHLPLAPLRYETLTVELGHDADPQTAIVDVQDAIASGLRERGVLDSDWLQGVALRLDVQGRVKHAHQVLNELKEQDLNSLHMPLDSVQVAVERHALRVLPPQDLKSFAEGGDPLASAANLLLDLRGENGEDAQHKAVAQLTTGLPARHAEKHFRALDLNEPTPDERIERLIQATERVLQGLLDQRGGTP